MPVLLTRENLRPLVEEPRWIEECLELFANALLNPKHGAMSWLLYPAAAPDTFLNIQVESAPEAGAYLRMFPDRLSPRQPADGQPALLFDAEDNSLLALMALDDLNHWRTAGPVGLAARTFAPENASTLAVLGSGAQAKYQLRAIRHGVPSLKTVRVFSRTPANRRRFADEQSTALGLDVIAVDTPDAAATDADIISVTAPATTVESSWVRPGGLVTTVLPRAVSPELDALVVVPSVRGPEVRSSGWDPRHGVSRPAAGRDPQQIDLTMVDVLRGTANGRLHPRQTVVYEQLGVFGWDVPLINWAYRRGQEISAPTIFELA